MSRHPKPPALVSQIRPGAVSRLLVAHEDVIASAGAQLYAAAGAALAGIVSDLKDAASRISSGIEAEPIGVLFGMARGVLCAAIAARMIGSCSEQGRGGTMILRRPPQIDPRSAPLLIHAY